jgi:Lipocalin-like domain
MNRNTALAAVLALCFATTATAFAQTLKEQIVGTWRMTSNTTTRPDGTKFDTFGTDPRGVVIFEANGQHALIIARSDTPKFASDNRATGTAEENKAAVQGSVAYFGTYAVDGPASYSIKIEGTTFPNWLGAAQKRNATISGDELTMSSGAGSAGGSIVSVWKKVK